MLIVLLRQENLVPTQNAICLLGEQTTVARELQMKRYIERYVSFILAMVYIVECLCVCALFVYSIVYRSTHYLYTLTTVMT